MFVFIFIFMAATGHAASTHQPKERAHEIFKQIEAQAKTSSIGCESNRSTCRITWEEHKGRPVKFNDEQVEIESALKELDSLETKLAGNTASQAELARAIRLLTRLVRSKFGAAAQ